ncbi:MAG: hypothetical protein SAK29_00565 [Scytonema sp. PMC 1069.18]|nr:hypothetical protein [Scytonema sp. PMC 1069.18]MEC4885578.1 hypothetical protein [Scytonema sp. PMC 1070.18]
MFLFRVPIPVGIIILHQSKRWFDLNKFKRDEIEFLQLYSLVVRALRLCDRRSFQLT